MTDYDEIENLYTKSAKAGELAKRFAAVGGVGTLVAAICLIAETPLLVSGGLGLLSVGLLAACLYQTYKMFKHHNQAFRLETGN